MGKPVNLLQVTWPMRAGLRWVGKTSPPLPGVFAHLAPVLDHYGYLAVGALILLEDFGVPAPGETILIAAAVYAGAGQLNVVAVGIIGLVAAVLGDNIGFAIGVFGGRPLALRYGRYLFLTEARLDRAHRLFSRHGGKIVSVARFIEGLRQINGIIAGISDMSWRRFIVFNVIGATAWVTVWLTIGYVAGAHLESIYRTFTRYQLYAVLAIVLLILVALARHLLHRHRDRSDHSDHSDHSDQSAAS